MKIALKLSADQIAYLHSTLSDSAIVDVAAFARADRSNKVVLSIIGGVAETFEDKFKEVSRKPTLFDTKKKYKITLQYHEAFAVNTIVKERAAKERDAWRKTTANKLFITIDEML